MEAAIRAIANPTRRAMLRLIWDAERPASEIARRMGLSRPAASQHLRVLREADLVRVRADGNQRIYGVHAERIAELGEFLEAFWGERLEARRAAAQTGRGARRRPG